MGALFSPPKIPAMPAPPPPPPQPPDVASIQKETQDEDQLSIKRNGRASNLLTGAQGDLSQVQTASKTLLGQ